MDFESLEESRGNTKRGMDDERLIQEVKKRREAAVSPTARSSRCSWVDSITDEQWLWVLEKAKNTSVSLSEIEAVAEEELLKADTTETSKEGEKLIQLMLLSASSFAMGVQTTRMSLIHGGGVKNKTISIIPAVARGLASTIAVDPSAKQEYEQTILPSPLQPGAFVHVFSYLSFVLALENEVQPVLTDYSKSILNQDFRKTWCPHPDVSSKHPNGVQLTRFFISALQDSTSQQEDFVFVQHATPIMPDGKDEETDTIQVCDIAIEVNRRIGVIVEYNPASECSLEVSELRACVYGTDAINLSRKSVLVVVVHGDHLPTATIRVLGIVPWQGEFTGNSGYVAPRHVRTLLYEGRGISGFEKVVVGIKAYLEASKQEKTQAWNATWLSPVTALHTLDDGSKVVYKVYDKRSSLLFDSKDDAREPHFDLVQKLIDPDARLYQPIPGVTVVRTKFFEPSVMDGTEWYGPVSIRRLGLLLEKLKSLHDDGYVHGDIRLSHTIPHAGLLIDFDIAQKVDENRCYPVSGLNQSIFDGRRASEVQTACQAGTIGKLLMKKEHDLESMKAVLELYEPVVDSNKGLQSLWQNEVLSTHHKHLFELIQPLLRAQGMVKLRDDVFI